MEKECNKLGLAINKSKSAIMRLHTRSRNPIAHVKSIRGYPVVEQYKYLGIIINNKAGLAEEIETRNKKIKELN